jgi:hypothetical protein
MFITQKRTYTKLQAFIDPSLVSGLSYWFKADALTLNDNDLVASWTDSSGNNRTATQSIADNKPVFKTLASPNYKPCVRFGGNDNMTLTGSYNNGMYIFIVANMIPSGGNIITGTSPDVNHSPYPQPAETFNMSMDAGDGGGGYPTVILSYRPTNVNPPFGFGPYFKNRKIELYEYTVASGSGGTLDKAFNVNGSNAAGGGGIGSVLNGPQVVTMGDGLQADIFEVIGYNKYILDPDASLIRGYLNNKYRIY